ncbi:MAG: porin family protein [Usitatibacter sp.]
MAQPFRLAALAIATLPALAAAEDYVGGLRAPRASQQFGSSFSLASEPINTFSPWQTDSALRADNGMKVRLGYQYSRYFAVESEFIDYGRGPADIFASPGNLVSAFRNTGYGVSTVATVPVWNSFSFYGRLGAYNGVVRNEFSSYSTSLLLGYPGGARWRYGLGVRYDFSQRFGVHADIERYTPIGTPVGEPDGDQISIGVNWRF